MGPLGRLAAETDGADALEYALVIALVALAIVAGATLMGDSINQKLSTVAARVTNCPSGNPSC